MLFLKKKWHSSVNAVLLVFMIMLGLYLFDDNIGLFTTLTALFDSAENAVRSSDMPQVEWTWQLGLLGGVFFGSFCGSLINGSFKIVWALEDVSGFTGKVFKSIFSSLISGFLVMLGAIMAGDVLLGQLSAAMEHSTAAWFFLVFALITAGITALFIERRKSSGGSAGKSGEGGK